MTSATEGTPAPEPTTTASASRSASKAWTLWLARRFGFAVLTLWLISVLVFAATNALGDPVRALLGRNYALSPERVAMITQTLHLDLPLHERYLLWLGGMLTGELGDSVASGLSVSTLIGPKLVNSLVLVLLTAVIMVPLSLGLAVLATRYRGGVIDHIIRFVTLALAGIPEFVTGVLLVALFSTTVFHLLPAITVLPIGGYAWENPQALILPVATLVIAIVPYLTRILRSNLMEAADSDYAELARLKGIPEGQVLRRHVLPNTVVPTIQVTALQLAWLLGGVVLIEYLFNYPGIGALLVDSVRNSDFPMVQALTMVIALAYVIVNLAADVLSILLTPRARTAMVA